MRPGANSSLRDAGEPRSVDGAVGVHQISAAMAARAPTFGQIASSVLAWLEAVVVVGTTPLRGRVSQRGVRASWYRSQRCPALDTLPLAQTFAPDAQPPTGDCVCVGGVTIDGPTPR